MDKKNGYFLQLRIGLYEQHRKMSSKSKPTRKQEMYRQKLELMTYHEAFKEQILSLRSRFNIPQVGFPDFASCWKWVGKTKKKAQEYENELKKSLRLLGIGQRWFDAIEYYLLFSRSDAHSLLPKTVDVRSELDAITGESILLLRIGIDTELRDIQQWWNTIEDFQGMIRSQRGFDVLDDEQREKLWEIDPLPHIERQRKKKDRKRFTYSLEKARRAYALRNEGRTYKEIAHEIRCMQGQVGTYIKRFRDAIEEVRLD